MKIKPFQLERYFSKYEFSAPYLLSCSDCEALTLEELMKMAGEDSLRLWENLTFGYTESQGHPLLREEVSKLYRNVTPDEILIVTPEEGIFIAMNSILEKGDHVIATFPGYQSLYEIAHSIGCEVSKWIPREDEGWFFNTGELERMIKDTTRLLIINFPHNPTGATLQENDFKKIVDLARRNKIILFSDEMYRLLEHDLAGPIPSASDLYDDAVSLFGLSKSFALAGLRIGWLVAKNRDLLRRFSVFKDYTTICSSAPSEIFAIMALRAKERILKRNLDMIKKNLAILDEFFAKYDTVFDWHRPNAGPVGFPKLKLDISAADFCHDLVKKKGVMLVPSEMFDFGSRHFRIGFARRNTPISVGAFEEYLKENY